LAMTSSTVGSASTSSSMSADPFADAFDVEG
jgi:hypothetical protein